MNSTGYQIGSGAGSATSAETSDKASTGYWSLSKCKKAYLDYLGNKTDEIEEQKNARRYYHSSQWTEEQIKALNKRKQPVVTFNRIGRKIDGVVGLIERLRQDPKAYPEPRSMRKARSWQRLPSATCWMSRNGRPSLPRRP
jgi:hypothetical protein